MRGDGRGGGGREEEGRGEGGGRERREREGEKRGGAGEGGEERRGEERGGEERGGEERGGEQRRGTGEGSKRLEQESVNGEMTLKCAVTVIAAANGLPPNWGQQQTGFQLLAPIHALPQ